jgi:hypothetical protein
VRANNSRSSSASPEPSFAHVRLVSFVGERAGSRTRTARSGFPYKFFAACCLLAADGAGWRIHRLRTQPNNASRARARGACPFLTDRTTTSLLRDGDRVAFDLRTNVELGPLSITAPRAIDRARRAPSDNAAHSRAWWRTCAATPIMARPSRTNESPSVAGAAVVEKDCGLGPRTFIFF